MNSFTNPGLVRSLSAFAVGFFFAGLCMAEEMQQGGEGVVVVRRDAGSSMLTGPLLPKEVGCRWEYQMSVQDFSADLVRKPNGEVVLPEPKSFMGKRVTEMVGLRPLGDSEELFACYANSISGTVVSEEYNKVTDQEVLSWGIRSRVRKDGSWKEQVFDPPLQIMQADLRRGASWYARCALSSDLVVTRRFDVLGEEPVKVEAGDYDAIKIRIVGGNSNGTLMKRYVWYVQGIGHVKIHTVHYGKGQVIRVEIQELVSFVAGKRSSESQSDEDGEGESSS